MKTTYIKEAHPLPIKSKILSFKPCLPDGHW